MRKNKAKGQSADWLSDQIGNESLEEHLWFRNWTRWSGDEEVRDVVKQGWLSDRGKEQVH